jgi:hypothetical protein
MSPEHAKQQVALLIPSAEFQGQELEKEALSVMILRYKVTNVDQESGSLSTLFKNAAELVSGNVIASFSITRSTLSQVFKSFARFQNSNDTNSDIASDHLAQV